MILDLGEFWDVVPLMVVLLAGYVGLVLLVVRSVWRAVASQRLVELAYRERLAIYRRRMAGTDEEPVA